MDLPTATVSSRVESGLGSRVTPTFRSVTNLAELRGFLEYYQAEVLIAHELPAIRRAFRHTSRNEFKELSELDAELSCLPILNPFLTASRIIGRQKLRRLLPLRDCRLVQRYIASVEAGTANGWHTLVYGLTLSVYSLSIVEGLIGYERQTILGFIQSVRRFKVTSDESDELMQDFTSAITFKPFAGLGEEDEESESQRTLFQ